MKRRNQDQDERAKGRKRRRKPSQAWRGRWSAGGRSWPSRHIARAGSKPARSRRPATPHRATRARTPRRTLPCGRRRRPSHRAETLRVGRPKPRGDPDNSSCGWRRRRRPPSSQRTSNPPIGRKPGVELDRLSCPCSVIRRIRLSRLSRLSRITPVIDGSGPKRSGASFIRDLLAVQGCYIY
jgi:hypothetical protein